LFSRAMGAVCSSNNANEIKNEKKQTTETAQRTHDANNLSQRVSVPQPVYKNGYPNEAFQNVDYQKLKFVGNANPDQPLYQNVPMAANQMYPNYQPNMIPSGRQDAGFQNVGYQRGIGPRYLSNPSDLNTSFQGYGYQDNGNQGRGIVDHGAPNHVNTGYLPQASTVSKTPYQVSDYQVKNTQIVEAGPTIHDSRNYQAPYAVERGTFENNDLHKIGDTTTTLGSVNAPTAAAPCNCAAVDPPVGGRKVYDPHVGAYVYEIDQNTEVNGFTGTAPQQGKYGVVN